MLSLSMPREFSAECRAGLSLRSVSVSMRWMLASLSCVMLSLSCAGCAKGMFGLSKPRFKGASPRVSASMNEILRKDGKNEYLTNLYELSGITAEYYLPEKSTEFIAFISITLNFIF